MMLKAKLRRFLSIRGNRQLVLTLTSAVSALAIMTSALSFFGVRQNRVVAEEHAVEVESLRDDYEQLCVEKTELQDMVSEQRSALVSVEHADEFRDDIIRIIRDSKCHLRTVLLGDHDTRRWMEGDSVDSDGSLFDNLDHEPIPSAYELSSQTLSLQVSGSFEEIQRLTSRIQELHRDFKTGALVMQVDAEFGMRLDWELLFFDLHRVEDPEEW